MSNTTAHVQRGDLIVLSRTVRTPFAEGTATSAVQVTLGVATSVSRDGQVKKWDSPDYSSSEPRSMRFPDDPGTSWQYVSKDRVSVESVMAEYRQHVWTTTGYTGDQIRHYDDVEDVKALMRSHVTRG